MPGFSLVPELISYNATMTSFEKALRFWVLKINDGCGASGPHEP